MLGKCILFPEDKQKWQENSKTVILSVYLILRQAKRDPKCQIFENGVLIVSERANPSEHFENIFLKSIPSFIKTEMIGR